MNLQLEAVSIAEKVFKEKGWTLDMTLIRSSCRKQKLVLQRRVIVAELRKNGYSLSEIGKFINRDHSTVIYTLSKSPGADLDNKKMIMLRKIQYYENIVRNLKAQVL